jgi:hypothetical protein
MLYEPNDIAKVPLQLILDTTERVDCCFDLQGLSIAKESSYAIIILGHCISEYSTTGGLVIIVLFNGKRHSHHIANLHDLYNISKARIRIQKNGYTIHT